MNLFHKIVYKTIPVNIPDYLTLYSGDSRLRRTHLDNLSFVSNIASTTTSINNLNKSFFFRTHTLWNSLPFDIRNSMRLTQFKSKLAKHFWSIAGPDDEQPEHEWSFQSSDEGSYVLNTVKLYTRTGFTNFGLGLWWSLSIEQVYVFNLISIYTL